MSDEHDKEQRKAHEETREPLVEGTPPSATPEGISGARDQSVSPALIPGGVGGPMGLERDLGEEAGGELTSRDDAARKPLAPPPQSPIIGGVEDEPGRTQRDESGAGTQVEERRSPEEAVEEEEEKVPPSWIDSQIVSP